MPVFNGGDVIAAAIDSLLAQDHSDFELIVADNASTDGTAQIVRSFARSDERVKYRTGAVNLGSVANFNRVLAVARGEFFMWAAHDDVWERRYVSSLLELLTNNPGAAVAFSSFDN